MSRLLGLSLLVAVVVVLVLYTTGGHGASSRRPYGMSEFLFRLGTCETHLNFRHDGGNYEGFVGWFWATWTMDKYPGYPSRAYNATPQQQIRVAYRSVARGRYFGCAVNSSWVRAAR